MAVNTWAAVGVVVGAVAVVAFAVINTWTTRQRRRGWAVPMQKARGAQREQRQEWKEFEQRQRLKAQAAAKTLKPKKA